MTKYCAVLLVNSNMYDATNARQTKGYQKAEINLFPIVITTTGSRCTVIVQGQHVLGSTGLATHGAFGPQAHPLVQTIPTKDVSTGHWTGRRKAWLLTNGTKTRVGGGRCCIWVCATLNAQQVALAPIGLRLSLRQPFQTRSQTLL